VADSSIEFQGQRLKIHDNGDGTFSVTTFDLSGGFLVSDQSLEFEGFRIQLHDNGDGTFSPVTTPTTGAGDVQCEKQGFRIKLHPTGQDITIGGLTQPMYAVVVFAV